MATETPLTKTDTRPPVSEMIAFIKEHREVCGVERICRVLKIAPSIARQSICKANVTRGDILCAPVVENDPETASDRAKRDAEESTRHREEIALIDTFGITDGRLIIPYVFAPCGTYPAMTLHCVFPSLSICCVHLPMSQHVRWH